MTTANIEQNTTYILLFLFLQLALITYAIFKLKKAVYTNYLLILEKTNQIPRNLTKGGKTGD